MLKANWLKTGTIAAFAGMLILAGTATPLFSQTKNLWTEQRDPSPSEKVIIGGDLFSRLAEKLSPTVVNVRSLKQVDPRIADYPFRTTPGPNQPPSYQQRGEGSGFIINKDGYILTNAHVVLGSDQVQVALSDGKLFAGKPVGIDVETDIALIKIDSPTPLPVLPLGSSEKLKPGEWVMAIGSPFGFDLTVTAGIVSGKGRSLGSNPFDDYIQTDTPINPGNSGGPLINTRGEAVGINTAVLAQGQGLGFSVPIDLVKKLIPQLREKGYVVRSWLGVNVQDVTLAIKDALKLKVDQGSFVVEVVAQGPAYAAGIQANDVIVEFDGHPIKTSRDLPKLIAHSPPGKLVPLKLMRGGKLVELKVKLQEMPRRGRP